MGWKMGILWLLVVLVLLGMAYVRLAPSQVARWHVAPVGDANKDFKRGALRVVETGPDGLARFDAIARAAPRTQVLAGSVAEGMATYVTRTRMMGFPDYTTAAQDGDTLRIVARSRFGRSDLGVNRKRLEGWLNRLQAGG
ncbi:hypothetical protein AVO45_07450 [Ruegeria marisrubri]|uniref:DUF1499 domain-containing protein n=1 Tax=Ruegeria marisrubri TaxID=1685379 RepID=A0A0X3TYM2_9RHOB|nr:DUF1499 domain-containing protein [Ruegeria marisrubri]KUJ80855.1 hypothetical protein AVO45_07450 [Ruegeria marisrubri]